MDTRKGTILRVNLSSREITKDSINPLILESYLGGMGIGVNFFTEEVSPNTDAKSPSNKIIITTGPLTFMEKPFGGGFTIVTKSPLTGTLTSSYSSGFFGSELKATGYDALIIEGKSNMPVYLFITNDLVEIREASHIWKNGITESREIIDSEIPFGSKSILIGPAGETLSNISTIINDVYCSSGHCGLGAVMGSKNLKAVSVLGDLSSMSKDKEAFESLYSKYDWKVSNFIGDSALIPGYGMSILLPSVEDSSAFLSKKYEGFIESLLISSNYYDDNKNLYKEKDLGLICQSTCDVRLKSKDSPEHCIEHEAIWALGINCGVNHLHSIMEANSYCVEMGLDSISTGATIATAMALEEVGLLKGEDLNDLTIKFGSSESLLQCIKTIALRKGFGDRMALGAYRLAADYNVSDPFMIFKGMEIPKYNKNAIIMQSLFFASSNRIKGYITPEIISLPQNLDKMSFEEMAKWVFDFQNTSSFTSSLGLTSLSALALDINDYAYMLDRGLGFNLSKNELVSIGEKIWNLEKKYNKDSGVEYSINTLLNRLEKSLNAYSDIKMDSKGKKELVANYIKLRG